MGISRPGDDFVVKMYSNYLSCGEQPLDRVVYFTVTPKVMYFSTSYCIFVIGFQLPD
jgi:hypothetical protein